MIYSPIQVVDSEDNPIKGAQLEDVLSAGLQHRVVRILLYDEQGNVLLQKRAKHMKTYPGLWDTSSAGYVDYGEDYEDAAKRELFEELGLGFDKLHKVMKYKIHRDLKDGKYRRFEVIFRAKISRSAIVKIEPKEVDEVRWFSLEEVVALVENNPQKITYGLKEVVARKGL